MGRHRQPQHPPRRRQQDRVQQHVQPHRGQRGDRAGGENEGFNPTGTSPGSRTSSGPCAPTRSLASTRWAAAQDRLVAHLLDVIANEPDRSDLAYTAAIDRDSREPLAWLAVRGGHPDLQRPEEKANEGLTTPVEPRLLADGHDQDGWRLSSGGSRRDAAATYQPRPLGGGPALASGADLRRAYAEDSRLKLGSTRTADVRRQGSSRRLAMVELPVAAACVCRRCAPGTVGARPQHAGPARRTPPVSAATPKCCPRSRSTTSSPRTSRLRSRQAGHSPDRSIARSPSSLRADRRAHHVRQHQPPARPDPELRSALGVVPVVRRGPEPRPPSPSDSTIRSSESSSARPARWPTASSTPRAPTTTGSSWSSGRTWTSSRRGSRPSRSSPTPRSCRARSPPAASR